MSALIVCNRLCDCPCDRMTSTVAEAMQWNRYRACSQAASTAMGDRKGVVAVVGHRVDWRVVPLDHVVKVWACGPAS